MKSVSGLEDKFGIKMFNGHAYIGQEVKNIPRHFEVDVELLSGEDECVLVRHGDEAEEPRRFRRTPLAAGAVCKKDVLSG